MTFKKKLIEINGRGTAQICFEVNGKSRVQCDGAGLRNNELVYVVNRAADVGDVSKHRVVNAATLQEYTPERWAACKKLQAEKNMFKEYCNAATQALRNGMIPESLKGWSQ